MRNTTVVTGGKPIAVRLQSISGESVVNPLVAFYNIHERNGKMLFFLFVTDTTQIIYDIIVNIENLFQHYCIIGRHRHL
jgi:hypothetical protein